MGIFQVVCLGLLVAVARSQELQNCSVGTSPFTVGSTEEAAALATSLQCSNGDFAVEWVGEVFVEETLRVTGGTSLNITRAGPGAIADGGGSTQLFVVDGGSRLHLSDMTLSNGNASFGGAIYANQSTILFTGNMSFTFNYAGEDGGAIYALDSTVSLDSDSTAFISNSASGRGGAINADASNVSWDGDGTEFSYNSAEDGGAIYAEHSDVSWRGDGTEFSYNSAETGGAIYAIFSTMSWDGDGTGFNNNSASGSSFSAGAIFADTSTVSWNGDGTKFTSNSANSSGGAIFVFYAYLSWDGDGTEFSNNSAEDGGGAIALLDGTVSWSGDGTEFSNNSAKNNNGGAIEVQFGSVSWDGDGTVFTSNSAAFGGAIYTFEHVSWDGDGTVFVSNSASYGGAIYMFSGEVYWDGDGTEFSSNSAVRDGGAIYSTFMSVFVNVSTTFRNNVAGDNGGALALNNLEYQDLISIAGTTFINNSAENFGGAVYIQNSIYVGANLTGVTFQSNSASGAGGALAAVAIGGEGNPSTFSKCIFSNNTSDGDGGAIVTAAGWQEFFSCEFVGNIADVGGAMRLGGAAVIRDCSFLSNSASTRGLAIAVVGSANISGSSFGGNEVDCGAGSYKNDADQGGPTQRFETVCFDCPDWNECSGCTIERGDVTPACETPLQHTTADKGGVTLETLNIDGGYWRATSESNNILACLNADACNGGITGADSFCASGYKGPYCAVCETDYSPSLAHTCTRCSSSRRHGLVAATVIAALVAIFAVATICKFLVTTEIEERNTGCLHRRVLRAVPVQALKIILVVWQILTQFADAANVTYPGVYQDFLSAIDVVNFDLGSVLAAGCLWSGIDFHNRLLVSTIGPLIVVGFLAMTYWIAMRRNSASSDAAAVEKIRHKHQTALLLVTFLVYSSVSSMVFQTFACETLDDDIEYLRADYRIHCTDAKHKAFEVYAGIMVFVYPVGIPLLYTVLLFQHSDVLANADADKTVAHPIAGLWEPYRPERFFYEVIECGRRVMLTGVVVFIFPNDAAQIAITMLIAFFFSMVFEVLSPYKSESDTWLSRGGHVIVFLSMFDLLLLKVDVSGERDQSQAAFAGVLVAGHVLMILAIGVEVVGICYASRKKKVLGGEEASERPRVGSDDVPVFESAPSSWRFLRQRSVSEKTGPTRSISGTVVTSVGGP